jgi:hypothetical protein
MMITLNILKRIIPPGNIPQLLPDLNQVEVKGRSGEEKLRRATGMSVRCSRCQGSLSEYPSGFFHWGFLSGHLSDFPVEVSRRAVIGVSSRDFHRGFVSGFPVGISRRVFPQAGFSSEFSIGLLSGLSGEGFNG